MSVAEFSTVCPSTIAQRQAWTTWKGVTSRDLTLHVIAENQEVEPTTTISQAANVATTTEQTPSSSPTPEAQATTEAPNEMEADYGEPNEETSPKG